MAVISVYEGSCKDQTADRKFSHYEEKFLPREGEVVSIRFIVEIPQSEHRNERNQNLVLAIQKQSK